MASSVLNINYNEDSEELMKRLINYFRDEIDGAAKKIKKGKHKTGRDNLTDVEVLEENINMSSTETTGREALGANAITGGVDASKMIENMVGGGGSRYTAADKIGSTENAKSVKFIEKNRITTARTPRNIAGGGVREINTEPAGTIERIPRDEFGPRYQERNRNLRRPGVIEDGPRDLRGFPRDPPPIDPRIGIEDARGEIPENIEHYRKRERRLGFEDGPGVKPRRDGEKLEDARELMEEPALLPPRRAPDGVAIADSTRAPAVEIVEDLPATSDDEEPAEIPPADKTAEELPPAELPADDKPEEIKPAAEDPAGLVEERPRIPGRVASLERLYMEKLTAPVISKELQRFNVDGIDRAESVADYIADEVLPKININIAILKNLQQPVYYISETIKNLSVISSNCLAYSTTYRNLLIESGGDEKDEKIAAENRYISEFLRNELTRLNPMLLRCSVFVGVYVYAGTYANSELKILKDHELGEISMRIYNEILALGEPEDIKARFDEMRAMLENYYIETDNLRNITEANPLTSEDVSGLRERLRQSIERQGLLIGNIREISEQLYRQIALRADDLRDAEFLATASDKTASETASSTETTSSTTASTKTETTASESTDPEEFAKTLPPKEEPRSYYERRKSLPILSDSVKDILAELAGLKHITLSDSSAKASLVESGRIDPRILATDSAKSDETTTETEKPAEILPYSDLFDSGTFDDASGYTVYTTPDEKTATETETRTPEATSAASTAEGREMKAEAAETSKKETSKTTAEEPEYYSDDSEAAGIDDDYLEGISAKISKEYNEDEFDLIMAGPSRNLVERIAYLCLIDDASRKGLINKTKTDYKTVYKEVEHEIHSGELNPANLNTVEQCDFCIAIINKIKADPFDYVSFADDLLAQLRDRRAEIVASVTTAKPSESSETIKTAIIEALITIIPPVLMRSLDNGNIYANRLLSVTPKLIQETQNETTKTDGETLAQLQGIKASLNIKEKFENLLKLYDLENPLELYMPDSETREKFGLMEAYARAIATKFEILRLRDLITDFTELSAAAGVIHEKKYGPIIEKLNAEFLRLYETEHPIPSTTTTGGRKQPPRRYFGRYGPLKNNAFNGLTLSQQMKKILTTNEETREILNSVKNMKFTKFASGANDVFNVKPKIKNEKYYNKKINKLINELHEAKPLTGGKQTTKKKIPLCDMYPYVIRSG